MARRPSEGVRPLSDVAADVRRAKAEGKRVVTCHGLFEILHPGLTRFLADAREHGDLLVVTLIPDYRVAVDPVRPVFSQQLRAEALAALQAVDHVAIDDTASATQRVQLLAPDVLVRMEAHASGPGPVLERELEEEEAAVTALGGEIRYAQQLDSQARILGVTTVGAVPPEGLQYVEAFRQKYSCDQVIASIAAFRDLKVLVIGDTIVDEYHFCAPFGMASKSYAIASRFLGAESYAGGALAIANHLAGFCDEVALLTCLGTLDSRESFVRERLKKNVAPTFVQRDDAPTIVKRRYVSQGGSTKLFEVSFFNDSPIPPKTVKETTQHLERFIEGFDLVLLADFGHGFVTPEVLTTICAKAKYLAVNTQLNSINMGFNVITKVPRADYACIDQAEVRMACRDNHSPIDVLVRRLVDELRCDMMTVTRGPVGAVTFSKRHGIASAPVFCRDVLDSTGAGDAFLSLTSPAAKRGLGPDLICFIGNAAGALAVRTIGNRASITPDSLFRFVRELLF
jgi:bifunctional ADP-heptose synthase (sugar kinase/adenylyltransferase)